METSTACPPGHGTSVDLGGLRITPRIVSEQTGGAFALLECILEPGCLGAPPHMHLREDEVSFILEGEIAVQVGEPVIEAKPGSVVFKPRGIFHAFWNPGTTPARFLELISPAGFEESFHDLALLLPAGGTPDMRTVTDLARHYHIDFDEQRLAELLAQYDVELAASWRS